MLYEVLVSYLVPRRRDESSTVVFLVVKPFVPVFFGLVFSFLGHTGVARVMCAGSPMFYESTHLPFCEHHQSYSMTEEFVPTSDVRLGRRLPQSTAVRVLHLLFPRVYLVSYDTSTCGHHYYARLCSDVDITWGFDCWPKCVSYHMRGKSSKTGW